jgi:predicted DCC family thiol-disulfide oxidoreductase YuxK
MVFDGDCNFCTLWIRRWQRATGDAVDYRAAQYPSIAALAESRDRAACRHRDGALPFSSALPFGARPAWFLPVAIVNS